MTIPFHFKIGNSPLLISMPHVGTTIPNDIVANMTKEALLKADTDWHLPLLYNMAEQLGASVISAEYSRYVIDLNRPKEDSNLYPGQDTTGLCPVDTFLKCRYIKGTVFPMRRALQSALNIIGNRITRNLV